MVWLIHDWFGEDCRVHFSHQCHEANFVVDWLAGEAHIIEIYWSTLVTTTPSLCWYALEFFFCGLFAPIFCSVEF